MSGPSAKGNEFEKEVELLLRLKGYSVTRNELICGTQIDIVAHKGDLLDNVCFVVECTDRDKPVGVELVKQKAAVLLTLKDSKFLYRLIFVARNGFTAESKAFASAQPSIALLTFTDLENQLVDFSPYVNWYIHNYQNSLGVFREGKLHGSYVELGARDENDNIVPSLTVEAKHWLSGDLNNLLFVLGDYGSGKTSFCRNLVYELLVEKYQRHLEQKFTPLLINLRDYRNAFNIQQLITDTLINQHGVALPSFMAFERMCSSGTVLLVLDGFDEMADRSDKQTLVDCFNQIYLLANLNAKIILTCRSNFFHSHSDVIELLKNYSIDIPISDSNGQQVVHFTFEHKARLLNTEKLNQDQIRQFIRNRFGADAESMFDLIESIHDLSDLSTRPVLLDMILTTLPELRDKKKRINSAALYEYYTNKWTARDEWRVHLPLKIRQAFCELLGWIMHNSEIQEMEYSFLEKAMAYSLHEMANSDEKLEQFKNDIQTCSFLVRTGKMDRFRFAHKSFLEFFVARKIITDLSEGISLKKPPTEDWFSQQKKPFLNPLGWDLEMGRFESYRSIRSLFDLDLRTTHIYGFIIENELAQRWPAIRSDASARALIEQSLREIFTRQGKSPISESLGISEEIATFAIEYLENLGVSFQEFLAKLKDEDSVALFSDILRLNRSVEFIQRNGKFMKSYVDTGDGEILKASFCSAIAKVPELVDLRFIEDSRTKTTNEAWSYFLFELASRSTDYSEIFRSCLAWENLRTIDKLVCLYGMRGSLHESDPSGVNTLMIRDLLKSANQDEQNVGLALCQLLTHGTALEMIAEVFRSEASGSSLKRGALSKLESLGGEDTRKVVLRLWSQEKDSGMKRELKKIEKRIRDVSSRKGTRVTLDQVRTNQTIRESMWRSLKSG